MPTDFKAHLLNNLPNTLKDSVDLDISIILMTLDELRIDVHDLRDAAFHYLDPALPQATDARGRPTTFQRAYSQYSASLADFHAAHIGLTKVVLEVFRKMKDDEMAGKVNIEDNDPWRGQARASRRELWPKVVSDDVTPTATPPVLSATSSQHEHDHLRPPPNTPSANPSDQHTSTLAPFPDLDLDDTTDAISPHPSLADFDPYSDTAAERQARYESWFSLHPGLRRAAQRSHSIETKAETAETAETAGIGRGGRVSKLQWRQKGEVSPIFEKMVRDGVVSLGDEVGQRNRAIDGGGDAAISGLEVKAKGEDDEEDFDGDVDGNIDMLAAQDAVTKPQNDEDAFSKDDSKDKADEQSTHQPVEFQPQQPPSFSGEGSHLSFGTLRGGGAGAVDANLKTKDLQASLSDLKALLKIQSTPERISEPMPDISDDPHGFRRAFMRTSNFKE